MIYDTFMAKYTRSNIQLGKVDNNLPFEVCRIIFLLLVIKATEWVEGPIPMDQHGSKLLFYIELLGQNV